MGERSVVHYSKMGCRLPALGQKPKLPHRNSNGRFHLKEQT
jgi:hypothetical protein